MTLIVCEFTEDTLEWYDRGRFPRGVSTSIFADTGRNSRASYRDNVAAGGRTPCRKKVLDYQEFRSFRAILTWSIELVPPKTRRESASCTEFGDYVASPLAAAISKIVAQGNYGSRASGRPKVRKG